MIEKCALKNNYKQQYNYWRYNGKQQNDSAQR